MGHTEKVCRSLAPLCTGEAIGLCPEMQGRLRHGSIAKRWLTRSSSIPIDIFDWDLACSAITQALPRVASGRSRLFRVERGSSSREDPGPTEITFQVSELLLRMARVGVHPVRKGGPVVVVGANARVLAGTKVVAPVTVLGVSVDVGHALGGQSPDDRPSCRSDDCAYRTCDAAGRRPSSRRAGDATGSADGHGCSTACDRTGVPSLLVFVHQLLLQGHLGHYGRSPPAPEQSGEGGPPGGEGRAATSVLAHTSLGTLARDPAAHIAGIRPSRRLGRNLLRLRRPLQPSSDGRCGKVAAISLP